MLFPDFSLPLQPKRVKPHVHDHYEIEGIDRCP